MSKIKNWLQNPSDYDTGVALYETYGQNNALKRILKSGPSVFNEEKLYKELFSLAENEASEGQTILVISDPQHQEIKKKVVPTAEFLALEKETKRHFAELSFLKSHIVHMATKEERQAACLRITKEFLETIHPAFEKLDYFREYNRFPDAAPIVVIEDNDPISLMRKRNNLRSYISKAGKGKMDKEKVPQWEAELTEVEKKLTAL